MGKPRTLAAIPLVLSGLLALPPASHAQWSPSATLDLGMGYGQMALSQSALDGARRLGDTSSKAFQSSADDWEEPTFEPGFESSPDISATVQQRFILFYGGDSAADRATMATKVESGEYQSRFRQLMERYGLEPQLDNLLDVTTTRYVALWEILHGRQVTSEQAGAVRAQLLAQYNDDFWMTRMDDAEKQELAETFVLHVAAAHIANEALQQRNDPSLLARYRAGVQQNLLPGGPRLDRMAISNKGFVRR